MGRKEEKGEEKRNRSKGMEREGGRGKRGKRGREIK